MNNVLYMPLPTAWKSSTGNIYEVNTWFQVGIQVQQLVQLDSEERGAEILCLLFGEENGTLREYPQNEEELTELIKWFLNGWNHDNSPKKQKKLKVMDFDIDQWRIYADFRQIYRINLNEAELHFWEFMGMLWNMPYKMSSFLQVIDIRTRKPRKNSGKEEIAAIEEAQQVYGLKQKEEQVFTKEEETKIDAYDVLMKKAKEAKQQTQEAINAFHNM